MAVEAFPIDGDCAIEEKPFGPLHRKEPPAEVVVIVSVWPAQIVPLEAAVGEEAALIDALSVTVVVQPVALETVKVYTPELAEEALLIAGFCEEDV